MAEKKSGIHVPANYPYQNKAKPGKGVAVSSKTLIEGARSGNLGLVKRALERGGDVGEKLVGFSSLHYAVYYNHFPVVEYLVEYGADVNDQNLSGITPLMRFLVQITFFFCWSSNYQMINSAIDKGYTKIITYLLEWDAEVNRADNKGITPLHKAVIKGDKENVTLLISWNADVNAKTATNSTPLHESINNSNVEIFELLIQSNADVNIGTAVGTTCLHKAIKKDDPRFVKLLLSNKADPNQKDSSGQSPLHIAVASNRTNVVKLLVDHKADSLLRDKSGTTPFCIAERTKSVKLMKLFEAD